MVVNKPETFSAVLVPSQVPVVHMKALKYHGKTYCIHSQYRPYLSRILTNKPQKCNYRTSVRSVRGQADTRLQRTSLLTGPRAVAGMAGSSSHPAHKSKAMRVDSDGCIATVAQKLSNLTVTGVDNIGKAAAAASCVSRQQRAALPAHNNGNTTASSSSSSSLQVRHLHNSSASLCNEQHHHHQQQQLVASPPQYPCTPHMSGPILRVIVFVSSCCFRLQLPALGLCTVGWLRRQIGERLGTTSAQDHNMFQLCYAGKVLLPTDDHQQFHYQPGLKQLHVLTRLWGG